MNCARVGPAVLDGPPPPKTPPAASTTASATALERAARGMRGRGIPRRGGRFSGQVFLGEQWVVAGALDHREQARHARNLLDLLLDEPLHELLAGVVAELTRK